MKSILLGGRSTWVVLTKTAILSGASSGAPVGTVMVGALAGNFVSVGNQIFVSRTTKNGGTVICQETTPVVKIQELEPGKKVEITTRTSVYTIEYDCFSRIHNDFEHLMTE